MTEPSQTSRPKLTAPRALIPLLAARPRFFTASIAPIFVGTALAYATTGTINPILAAMALLAIVSLHAGANLANDYFDHLSQNDWLNQNPTPFYGGSRFIQNQLLSPKATLLAALVAFIFATILGLLIVAWTQSLFILALGLAGLLGGFFYTARPIQLGYRSVGELTIFLCFGALPVYAAYYLQTKTFAAAPLAPACIVGLLIFLVILINEFPDLAADAAVNKKTLIVRLGIPTCIWLYRIALLASFVLAASMLLSPHYRLAGALYLLTAPLAVLALKTAHQTNLTTPGHCRANQLTILLHALGSLALTTGFALQPLWQ